MAKFILKASDNQSVEFDSIDFLKKSKLIMSMLEDYEETDEPEEIPLPNVNYQTLNNVKEFLEYQDELPEIEKPLKSNNLSECGIPAWYVAYIDKFDKDQLFNIILAANYLDIPTLLDLGCAKVASMIKGKTPDEIRVTFNVPKEETTAATATTADTAVAVGDS